MDKRGGARPGAGRPKGKKSDFERKYYSFRLTKPEHEKVKEFVKEIRGIKMNSKEVLKEIWDVGGFDNFNHWDEKQCADWVQANYDCSRSVAMTVAKKIVDGSFKNDEIEY